MLTGLRHALVTVVCAVAAMGPAALVGSGCADQPQGTPEGEITINMAALRYTSVGLVSYRIAVYELSADGGLGEQIWAQDITSADYGSPSGSVLYIGPCVAGATGVAMNKVSVQLLDVQDDDGNTVRGLVLPPVVSDDFECVENADTRVEFNFTVARSAELGFADITVDIDDVFCSAKTSCETALMPHPDTGVRGPTLVTGLACTGGADTAVEDNFVGFEGTLCCGDSDCRSVTIGADGAPVWVGESPAIVATRSYFGDQDSQGRRYHNTSWLLDLDEVGAGCVFEGFGFVNSDPDGPALAWEAGDPTAGLGAAPGFHFAASIGADGACDPASTGVFINFSDDPDAVDTDEIPAVAPAR